MKICLTGSGGLLGNAFTAIFRELKIECIHLDRKKICVENIDFIRSILSECDVVIHAAANTNVEECEINETACYIDNTFLTELLFIQARATKTKFVFISSTGVYGEYKTEPYHEYDRVIPTTHHHKSKYFAENIILTCPESLVVRTGWLFGGHSNSLKNFVVKRIQEAIKSEGIIYSNAEQFGCPTFVSDLAFTTINLIYDKCNGVFNCVNNGFASRLDYVRTIIELAGLDVQVQPTTAMSFNRVAKVSNNEMAINLKLKLYKYKELPSWQESLRYYIHNDLSDILE